MPTGVKTAYRNASFFANNRVIFNIQGNKYRITVAVKYKFKLVFSRFVGTHRGYDQVDAATV